jgi:hypothetical protein
MLNKAAFLGGSFTKVYKPTITSPTASQILTSRTPTITSSAFSKYGNITHISSDWQVSDSSDFNTIRWSSTNDTSNKISIISSDLAGGNRYVRVRHKASNGVYSDWSDVILFISPWAIGTNGVSALVNSTVMEINSTDTVTVQPGSYRITLWGGGGGGATGGGNGGGRGGGAGSVYKDVLYTNATVISFNVGTAGIGGTQTGAGNGGSPGGGAGLNIGNGSWNGAGGGGSSSVSLSGLTMTAAGGGGAAADRGSSGDGVAGGVGTGSAGFEWINIPSSSGGKSGGFSISDNYDTNFSRDTGCSVSGTYSCSFSFGNMQGKKINVKLVASGDSGTKETVYSCCDGSGSLSLSFNGDYRNIAVYYQWCGSGTADITTNLSVSWSGTGKGGVATAGSSGGGGGGGGNVLNGNGASPGIGGTNSGTYTQSSNGSGFTPGNSYYSNAFQRTFGEGGGSDGTSGQNGGAKIQKIPNQYQPVVSITSNLSSTASSTAGNGSSFSITATDTANNDSTVAYQWYLSIDGTNYSPISGQTTSTLTRYQPFYYSDNGHKIKCRATVTNTAGTNSADSTPCTLTVARLYTCSSLTTGTREFDGGDHPSTNGDGDAQWWEWSPGYSDICAIDGNLSTFDAKGRFCNWNMELELRITRSTDNGSRKHWGSQSKSGSTNTNQSFNNVKANGADWNPEEDGTPTYKLMVIDSGTQCQNGSQDIGCNSSNITLNYSYKRRTYQFETRP